MDSETSAFNSDSSSFTRDRSMNFQTDEYSGYFYWAAYFNHLNKQSMMNFPAQVGSLNLTEKYLNPSHLLIQQCNYAPTSTSTSSPTSFVDASSSLNMENLCRYNPSNLSKNGKNPGTDNNSLKCGPNCDEWNLKDNINEYLANGPPSNQCTIYKDLDGDCSQTIAIYDHDYNGHKKEMAVRKEIQNDFESRKVKRCASRQIHPINQPQFMDKYQTNDYAIVDENQMDEIITKELDLALSLSKKCRKKSRSHRFNQQTKEKTPKSRKRSRTRDKLISVTVERIKAAVFSCNPNPSSFQKNKISNHEENQQLKQNQSFPQPEFSNQYQTNNAPQLQYPKFMCQSKPEVMRQSSFVQPVDHIPNRCTCKSFDARMNNNMPSSSVSASNHSNIPLANNSTRIDHSVYTLLRR